MYNEIHMLYIVARMQRRTYSIHIARCSMQERFSVWRCMSLRALHIKFHSTGWAPIDKRCVSRALWWQWIWCAFPPSESFLFSISLSRVEKMGYIVDCWEVVYSGGSISLYLVFPHHHDTTKSFRRFRLSSGHHHHHYYGTARFLHQQSLYTAFTTQLCKRDRCCYACVIKTSGVCVICPLSSRCLTVFS